MFLWPLHVANFLWGGLENLVVLGASLVYLEDGCLVSAPIAVVGRRPDGDALVMEHRVVALHDQLMGPGYQVKSIVSVEFFDDVSAEKISGTAGTHLPS